MGWDRVFELPEVCFVGAAGDDGEELALAAVCGTNESWMRQGATVIVCPVPEMGGHWEAIRDRLRKAAMK